MTIKVVTDSACDLSDELIAQYGISIVPLSIRFGDEELVDREQLSVADFWKRLRESDALPETAAPSAGRFEQTFRALAADGATGIVCVTLSSEVSATTQSAVLAAQAVANEIPVRVVDSRFVSMGIGLLAISAARRINNGESLDAIGEALEEERTRLRLFGTLETLEFLRRGGRVSNAKALFGSMLSVKPILEVRDGRVEEAGKVRTRSKALREISERVKDNSIDQIAMIGGDATDLDELRALVEPLAEGAEVFSGDIGPVVGTHAGPGVVGVVFRIRA
ncbi:MAG: DegV family protein [Acidimicrobiia bacterium]